MEKKLNQRGFTLVEMIITIAIMAIIATVTVGATGYINSGKTKKASNKLNSKLTFIQTETMTKKGDTNLYIYKKSDGIYICTVNASSGDFTSRTELDTYLGSHDIESKLCDSKVTLTGETTGGAAATPLELNENNMLKIGYSKSTGAFTYSNNGSTSAAEFYNRIEMSGKQTFHIRMIQATGKHYIEES